MVAPVVHLLWLAVLLGLSAVGVLPYGTALLDRGSPWGSFLLGLWSGAFLASCAALGVVTWSIR